MQDEVYDVPCNGSANGCLERTNLRPSILIHTPQPLGEKGRLFYNAERNLLSCRCATESDWSFSYMALRRGAAATMLPNVAFFISSR